MKLKEYLIAYGILFLLIGGIVGYTINEFIPRDCTGKIIFSGTYENTKITTNSKDCNVNIHDTTIIHLEKDNYSFMTCSFVDCYICDVRDFVDLSRKDNPKLPSSVRDDWNYQDFNCTKSEVKQE